MRGRHVGKSIFSESLERRVLLSAAAEQSPGEVALDCLPPVFADESPPAFEVAEAPPFGLEQTFLLHSRPAATKVIYLDFDGHTTSGTSWNSAYAGGADIVTGAYTFEGDSSFSANEQERIQKIWQRVSEDYAPFDVDVTTQEPALNDLRNTGGGDTRWGIRVVIGGNGSWYGSAGGVAYIGSFTWSSDTPCFVFEDMLSNGNEKYVAEACSHEVGHTLGLLHDGRTTPAEAYYEGHGSGATGWAPIMGVAYYRELGQWSKGEYPSANQTQDDLAIITASNGFGYRTDDHGNTAAAATALTVGAAGVIERTTDVDVFSFSFPAGGAINLTISPFANSPNLDILAEIYNSSNVLVASSNPADALNATLNLSLSPDSYSLHISGVGKGDLTTGYSDYGSLGYFSISGAFDATPAAPVNPSPADGASGVARTGLVLNWDDSQNAVSYDVYLDNLTVAAANVTASQWTVSPEVTGGTHQWKVVARNGITTASSAVWSFAVPLLPVPGMPTLVAPTIGAVINAKPLLFDWSDVPDATSYDFYLLASTTPTASNLTASEWTGLGGAPDFNVTWHVVAKNADHSTVGPNWTFVLDVTAPTATLAGATAATGAAYLDFNVTYADARSGVDVASLDGDDILVSGPNGYSAAAAFVSVNNATNGSPRIATYRMPAPGGFWNDADHGSYTVAQAAAEVCDLGQTYRPAGTIGTLNIANLGTAWMSASTLMVACDGSATPVLLSTSGASVRVTKNGNSVDFAGVSGISVLGSSADDRVQINAPLSPPVAFVDSAGNDVLEVTGGTYTFAADIAPASANVGIEVESGAEAVFGVSQHLRDLSVDGIVTLSPGGGNVLAVRNLAVSGRLNLADNSLVWEPAGGGALASVSGWVASGRNGGDWQGNGIVTDQTSAISPATLMTLGISQAASGVIVKYTYAGDADLDGAIDGDDYFAIDSGFVAQAGGYAGGDFNHDGAIDADDYFLIDSNYNKAQTAPALAPAMVVTAMTPAAKFWWAGDESPGRLIEELL